MLARSWAAGHRGCGGLAKGRSDATPSQGVRIRVCELIGFCRAAPQGIEDVEDTPEGATMRYLDITDLIERVRANVEAIHVCKSYYMSHAYREVRARGSCCPER